MSIEIYKKFTPSELKPALLDFTSKLLIDKNRRYYGIAATSLKNQLDDPKYFKEYKLNSKLINAGISGEKQTSLILRKWIKDKPDCILVDSISLPLEKMTPEIDGEEGQLDLGDTDHLLIIGSTLIIIDSKNWKSKASYRIEDDMSISRSKKSFPGNKPRINQAKYLWKKYFEDYEIDDIFCFVCISATTPIIVRDKNWWRPGYKLVNQDTLIEFLDKTYQEEINNKGFIRIELLAKTLTGLVEPYNKYKEKFGEDFYNKLVPKV